MKARQVAIARNSVYARDLRDEVQLIERDPDGLWGKWRSAGARAKELVHGGQIVAAIGADDRIGVLQLAPALPWHTWELQAVELTATHLPDGAPVLLAVDGDDLAWYTWKPTPASPWTDWQSLDGPVSGVAADAIPGGGLVVFGIRDGTVYHRWQDRPQAPWKEWTALGKPAGAARALKATTINRGGLALFAVGVDGAIHHRWQDKPFGTWHEWLSLGGHVEGFTVCKSPGGGLALFTIGSDGEVEYRYQSKAFGEWSPWASLGGRARTVAAQMSYQDGLEVFAIGMNEDVIHKWCDRIDMPWTEWSVLDFEASPVRPLRYSPTSTKPLQ